MTKVILMATAMIVASNSIAAANDLRVPSRNAFAPGVYPALRHPAFDLANPEPASEAGTHQYHGGPKSND